MPANIVSALSVGLYGMFIAIIIPPARKSKIVGAVVAFSMAASFAFAKLPVISDISSGMQTIILTVAISALAAFFFPVKEDSDHEA